MRSSYNDPIELVNKDLPDKYMQGILVDDSPQNSLAGVGP